MKKKLIFIITIILIILILGILVYCKVSNQDIDFEDELDLYEPDILSNTDINIVTSLEDEISANTAWCGTFNLIWNDLKNDLAKQDIEFTPQLDIVKNLNKGTFNTSYLSEDSYYKIYGTPNLELKAEIEKAIKEKFDETSDILDDFDWGSNNPNDYFLYSMLKKEFEFPQEFTELENGKFGNYDNVKYFGINENTDESARKQVEVLYYNSKEDFAVKLLTKDNDEVIVSRGNKKNNFKDIYDEILQNSEKYEGEIEFGGEDILQIPNIDFDLKEEISEVENKSFNFSDGVEHYIEKALQTILFELDKKGGKIKSEAGMMLKESTILMTEEAREFIVDDTFTIFLKEQEKDLPYFAAKISDISTVQDDVKVKENEQAYNYDESYFYGKVVETNENSIIIEPNEGEGIQEDRILINLGENSDYIYEVGTNVKITYDGIIMTSYPAQVNAIDIEIKSAEDFEIEFTDKSGENKSIIIDKNETDKYDYNVFAVMGEVNILINNEEMPLRDALLNGKITMSEIIAKANKDLDEDEIEGDMYQDGGSMIYQYDDYTIIKLHDLAGNRDVYIGNPEMTINNLGG